MQASLRIQDDLEPQPDPGENDRRRHSRQRVRTRAWFDAPNRAVFTKLHDISEGGVCVRGSMPFQDGDELLVTVGAVRARAEVRWSTARPGAAMGFRFLEVLDGGDELVSLTKETTPF